MAPKSRLLWVLSRGVCLGFALLFTACAPGVERGEQGDSDMDEPSESEASEPAQAGNSTCAERRCNGNGKCTRVDGKRACDCDSGYEGARCGSCSPGYESLEGGRCAEALVTTIELEPGERCQFGGVLTQRGVDLDADGELDPGEVLETEHECEEVCADEDLCGAHGRCVAAADGPLCLCESGYSGDLCDACEPGYVSGSMGCTLPGVLSERLAEGRGVNCEHGGERLVTGLDVNADGKLSADEITDIIFDCNSPIVREGDVTIHPKAQLLDLRSVTEVTGTFIAPPVKHK